MTETMIDLPGAIAKSDDADFLRELIQDVAQRLMDIEVAAVCGAGHGERSPDRENQRLAVRSRDLLDRVPALAHPPQPAGRAAGDQRRTRGPQSRRPQGSRRRLAALPRAFPTQPRWRA
ncbi:MAG: transposase [Roseovarius sp.]|nr:transposase [Roseovarius sp.]